LASSIPADEATGVALNTNILLTFSEAIAAGTGNITISDGASDTRTIPVDDAQITISGTTLTINPTADLNGSSSYSVQIAATAVTDLASNSYAGITNATTLNFTTAAPSNTAPVANAGPDQTVTSGALVTLDGRSSTDADGNTLIYAWTQPQGAAVSLSSPTAAQPTFTAPTLNMGDADVILVFSLIVNDTTVNSSADTISITVQAPSLTPATAFADNAAVIREVLTAEAGRSVRNAIATNQLMVQGARQRFIAGSDNGELAMRDDIPFDIDGDFSLSGVTLSTSGTFFGQEGATDGSYRRLIFGDFNVQQDSNTGATTATLAARIAWERRVSDTTLLGYVIGAEFGDSEIQGSFAGGQNQIAVTLGGYAVHQLAQQLYLDGFVTVGAGRNDLEMSNNVLALTSDYTTRMATIGAALSGAYTYTQYDFRPELALSYGHTWIGTVGFSGLAYGLVDNNLSLDAGAASLANLTLRPEVIWALDADTVADSKAQLSFAPRMICERARGSGTTEVCGGGAEVGLTKRSQDGLSTADVRVTMDRLGDSNRSSVALNLEHRF
jgi:hypothetical protein